MSENRKKRSYIRIYILTLFIVLIVAYFFLGIAPKQSEAPIQKPLQESNRSKVPPKQSKVKTEQNATIVTEANITKKQKPKTTRQTDKIQEQNTTKTVTKITTPKKEVHIENDIELIRFETQSYAQNTKRTYQEILGEDFPLHVKAVEDGNWAVIIRPNEEYDTAKIMQQLQDNAIEVE